MGVAIIGPYPKPFGGISVHIRNFNKYYQKFYSKKLLINIFGGSKEDYVDFYENVNEFPTPPLLIKSLFNNLFYRFSKKRILSRICLYIYLIINFVWFLKTLIKQRIKLIHFQGSADWKWRILIVIASKLIHAKSILSVHGPGVGENLFQIDLLKKLSLKQKFYWIFIRKYDHIICDNEYQINQLKSLQFNKKEISLINEFIPPEICEEDYDNIPEIIQNFYKNNKINLFGIGWNLFYDKINLYGIDMMLNLMKEIENRFSNIKIGLTLKIYDRLLDPHFKQSTNSIWKFEPLESIKNQIKKMNLKNILLIDKDIPEIYPLIENADLYIRPTYSDGDSVSIRESLYFNTPVITSDAIFRPKGCILFKNRDQNDFNQKIFVLLNKILKEKHLKKKPVNIDENNAEKIIQIYFYFLKKHNNKYVKENNCLNNS